MTIAVLLLIGSFHVCINVFVLKKGQVSLRKQTEGTLVLSRKFIPIFPPGKLCWLD